ncbi:MAG: class I SAM-dependent methyltransferase [Solirubrobacteraceae bacterium]
MDTVARRNSLDGQRSQWERALSERPDRFGTQASEPARATVKLLRRQHLTHVLELGPAHGRDTLFFASQGFEIHALDYAPSAVAKIKHEARDAGISARVTAVRHDVREPLPYPDESFGCCYSHMLFCMALTMADLRFLTREILRVLRPGGLCIYTARSTRDPDFAKGIHHGEGLYESGGFIVHFFTAATVKRLANGFEIIEIAQFEEGPLPRRLYRVSLRKPTSR